MLPKSAKSRLAKIREISPSAYICDTSSGGKVLHCTLYVSELGSGIASSVPGFGNTDAECINDAWETITENLGNGNRVFAGFSNRTYHTLDFLGRWVSSAHRFLQHEHSSGEVNLERVPMETIEFNCPTCGSNRLEEVMVGVIVATEISDIVLEDGEADCVFGEQTNEDGEVDHYQCADCGHVVKGARTPRTLSELAEVLKA